MEIRWKVSGGFVTHADTQLRYERMHTHTDAVTNLPCYAVTIRTF